jgi:hypothetical protein
MSTIIDRGHTLKGIVVLMHKNALSFHAVGDTNNNEDDDTVAPSFLDTSVALKLISASKADGIIKHN